MHSGKGGGGWIVYGDGVVFLRQVACEGMVAVGLGLQFPYLEGGEGNHYLDYMFAFHCLKALRCCRHGGLWRERERERPSKASWCKQIYMIIDVRV